MSYREVTGCKGAMGVVNVRGVRISLYRPRPKDSSFPGPSGTRVLERIHTLTTGFLLTPFARLWLDATIHARRLERQQLGLED